MLVTQMSMQGIVLYTFLLCTNLLTKATCRFPAHPVTLQGALHRAQNRRLSFPSHHSSRPALEASQGLAASVRAVQELSDYLEPSLSNQSWSQNFEHITQEARSSQNSLDSNLLPLPSLPSRRRELVDLPPIILPPIPQITGGPPALVILAPNRTHRRNPLDGLQFYAGGWDFLDKNYWASLAWTTSYPAFVGIVWTLFGLGFVGLILCICVCCPGPWHRLRDKRKRFDRKQLTLPLIFLIFGVLLECVGLGLSIAGGVKMSNDVTAMTNFAADTVDRITGIVLQVTPIVRNISQITVLNVSLPAGFQDSVAQITSEVDQFAQTTRDKANKGRDTVNNALNIVELILFILCCVIVGATFVGLTFTLCRLVVFSNILTGFIWAMCLVTWILVTVFLFIWLFGGDTDISLNQIAQSPTDLTKFNLLVPCLDPAAMNSIAAYVRFAAATAIIALNATISQEAPVIFQLLKAPNGLCSPFGPAPNYTFYESQCTDICDDQGTICYGPQITIQYFANRLSSIQCRDSSAVGCVVLTTAIRAAAVATVGIVQGARSLTPLFGQVLKCAYISYLARALSDFVYDLEEDALLLWMGFLFISVGALFYAVCAPIYVYRAVRSYSHPEEMELEPMAPTNDEASPASENHATSAYENGYGARPFEGPSDGGFLTSAKPAQY